MVLLRTFYHVAVDDTRRQSLYSSPPMTDRVIISCLVSNIRCCRAMSLKSSGSMLDGYRILIVHADPMIGEHLALVFMAEGADIVGPARDLKHALEFAETTDLRVGVLNFILEGANTLPIAERLHQRGVPIVFFTAMDREYMQRTTAHLNATVLANPADSTRIVPVIEQLIGLTRQ